MRSIFVFVAFYAVMGTMSTDILEPAQLAPFPNDDDFEDYLDAWLEWEEPKWVNASNSTPHSGCIIRVNGDLGHPQPVYIRAGTYLQSDGNSGLIRLNTGEQVIVACTRPRSFIQHPNVTTSVDVSTATCVKNSLVSGSGWLTDNTEFGQLTCSSSAQDQAHATASKCWDNNLVIRVGYIVENVFHPLYFSCFNEKRMEVLYVWYNQTPENVIHQTGVGRIGFRVGSFYPGVSVDTMYSRIVQKNTISEYVGESLADKYITNTQYLSRGHIAAKTDFVFATAQRASFYFINAAPQWSLFNSANWNSLEQNLRARISAAGYRTVIYTGTFGVTQLRDQNNNLVDIYLVREINQIPVPMYFYKVVYDASRRQGTAFIGINNPYYTETEVRNLTFCTDRCRNNSAFHWLRWQPDRIDRGYSFCCTVDDFRKTVPHLLAFVTDSLLT